MRTISLEWEAAFPGKANRRRTWTLRSYTMCSESKRMLSQTPSRRLTENWPLKTIRTKEVILRR